MELIKDGLLFSEPWHRRPPGETILKFEEEFAKWCGVKYALAHTNGTSALQAALFAVGVGPGDEVIVPSYSIYFSIGPILACNAVPVFCDVDPETMSADPTDIATRVTPRTKAILVVHMNGMPCAMDDIREITDKHDLAIVEDACGAPWATYNGTTLGTIGHAGAFSIKKIFNWVA